MNEMNQYSFQVCKRNDVDCFVLAYTDEKDPANNLEAWIAPGLGSNLFRFSLGGQAVIDANADMLAKSGFPGTPVLYPTPNRVRDGKFVYRDRVYEQRKNGKPVLSHGLVLNEPWEYGNLHSDSRGASAVTWIDFLPGTAIYEPFPFRHRLSLHFLLTRQGISIMYRIENQDTVEIPFGFGLHPFFSKLSGDENTYVSIPAAFVMEHTDDLLPTGRLLDVSGTEFDLRKDIPVGSTNMDHVFTGLQDGESAGVYYREQDIRLCLKATPDFSHIVYFSPQDAGIFCIENQTCSTDAHNLYHKGFVKESGLKMVMPGQAKTGTVQYLVSRTNFDCAPQT